MFFKRQAYIDKIQHSIGNTKITILTGARQVGKTTLMKYFYKKHDAEALWYSFDSKPLYEYTNTQAFLSYIYIHAKGKYTGDLPSYIYLDEVQNVKNIGHILKDIHDNYNIKLIISGSGSIKIWKFMHESLVGRKEIITIWPLSFQEYIEYKGHSLDNRYTHYYDGLIKDQRHLIDEYLRYGGFPAVVFSPDAATKLQALEDISSQFVDGDLRALLQDDTIDFVLILRLLAGNVCNLLKLEQLLQELQITRKKLKKITDIITKSYRIHQLPPYLTHQANEITSKHKLYFIDTGILNYLNKQLGYTTGFYSGKVIENFVISQLMITHTTSHRLHFWKKQNGSEIDIVLKNKLTNTLTIAEIKSKSTTTTPKIFHTFPEEANKLLLNKDQKTKGTVELLPWIFTPKITS